MEQYDDLPYGDDRDLAVHEEPDQEQLERWVSGTDMCESTDGCTVEPDGWCPHEHMSWLMVKGLV